MDSEIATNMKYMEQLDTVLSKLSKIKLETLHHINCNRLTNMQKRCETLKMQIKYVISVQ